MTKKEKKAEAAPQAQDQTTLALPYQLEAQYIKDLSFENPHVLEGVMGDDAAPSVNVNIQVNARPLQDNAFEVNLGIEAQALYGEKVAYVIEVAYAGVFTIAENLPKEHVGPLLLIECPRLLFPFARAIVADLTRDSGYPPLMLAPVNFVEMYQRQLQAQQETPAPQAEGHA